MRITPGHGRWAKAIVATFVLLMVAGAAVAQVHTGNVFGRTVEKSGTVLPGVTVTLTGLGAPQVFTTDAQGQFRFLGLAPGSYSLLAELQGFSKVNRKNVVVAIGSNTEVDLVLSASVAETITVTAATPVLDRRQTGTAATLTVVELDKVPTARDPWVLLQSVPGVLVDRVNVGGNKSGQQSVFIGKGVERNQTVWNLDGIGVGDMSTAPGSSGFYYDFESFQEFNIATGSADPSVQTPGVQINMVTKRATNEINGSARYLWTDQSLQSDPKIPAEGAQYNPPLVQSNSIDNIEEYGAEAGGPIMKDKLWLWAAYSQNPITNLVAGSTSQYQKVDLKNWNAKVNLQLNDSNGGALSYTYSLKTALHRNIGPSRPVETSVNQGGPGWVWKLEDTQNFGSSLYVTGRIGWLKNGYTLTPVGGLDTMAWFDEKGIPHDSYYQYVQDMPQQSARADGAKFIDMAGVNHELKFGFGYKKAPVESLSAWPGGGVYLDKQYDWVAVTRDAKPKFHSKYFDAYLGDTMIMGNFTLVLGLRYDNQSAKNDPNNVPANGMYPDLLPAVSWAGDSQSLVWKGIAPRLGATYNFGSAKKTMVRGTYARYMDQMTSNLVGANNPFYYNQYLYYYWNDLNKDGKFQKNEIGDLADWYRIDPNHVTEGYSMSRVDYGMKPIKTDEFTLAAETELMPAFSLGASYTYRKRSDMTWSVYEKTRGAGDYYKASDFVQAGTTAGTLPDGTAYSMPYYTLAKGVPKVQYRVLTTRPDYYQSYDGIELTATKRMQNNWMVRANVTFSDWKQHVGKNGLPPDPTILLSGSSCFSCAGTTTVASSGGSNGYINSRWAGAINGLYEFKWGISTGAALSAREGYIIPYYRRVRTSEGYGNRSVLLSSFDNYRLPNMYNLDLRVAKEFRFSGFGATVSADLFNATNQQTVLWRDNRMYSSNGSDISTNNWIMETQSPRIWRLGAKFTF